MPANRREFRSYVACQPTQTGMKPDPATQRPVWSDSALAAATKYARANDVSGVVFVKRDGAKHEPWLKYDVSRSGGVFSARWSDLVPA